MCSDLVETSCFHFVMVSCYFFYRRKCLFIELVQWYARCDLMKFSTLIDYFFVVIVVFVGSLFFYFKICPKAKNEDLWGNISWMLILCGTFSKLIRLNLFNFFTLALAVVLYRFFNALFNYIAKIHVSCQHLSCLTYIAYHFQNWSSERIENIQANFYE